MQMYHCQKFTKMFDIKKQNIERQIAQLSQEIDGLYKKALDEMVRQLPNGGKIDSRMKNMYQI